MFFLFSVFNVFLFTQQNVMKRCVIISLEKKFWKNASLWSKNVSLLGAYNDLKNQSLFFF